MCTMENEKKLNTQIPIEIVRKNTSDSQKVYFNPKNSDFEHIKTMYENGLLKIRLYKKQAS